MQELFQQHLQHLQQLSQDAIFRSHLEGIWIHAGQEEYYFLDDQTKPFKINPLFNYFVPNTTAEGSWLYIDGTNKPHLYLYSPQDYWHYTAPPQDDFWTTAFEWTILSHKQDIIPFLKNTTRCAYLGAHDNWASELGFHQINPQKILNFFHYHRSIKTDYEIACMKQAQSIAYMGHQHIQQCYLQAEHSEYTLNLAYLQATKQTDISVPYSNIIAFNQHAATLHYTQLSHEIPAQKHSLLIDAGASYLGYAADITRTYSFENNEFAAMIQAMDQVKHHIIASLQVGYNFLSYHTHMHQMISNIIHDFDLVHLSADAIFEEGISRTFCPHGLGHLLGLQVHDTGGFLQNIRGSHKAPPDIYPSLRCTRDLQPNMVLTIEPGFYFIDMLLDHWKNHALSRYFNWEKLAKLRVYGGIRTEDNVRILPNGVENLYEA
ncbi:Xaa-Pro dipeptidase [Conservatibacter flavescens]|uniref:Xaa-Pro dipeptidase n=1 Tax=Conservatibacter flavescens TaxID=28161 RepID=A0A2M8S1I6_9PAST|nr:Xaa-Pro dipeptidase [Conservatibacter flavescens]PJG85029.1 Xaa-Pro dipeptidase [Conservatibacter flavescens]